MKTKRELFPSDCTGMCQGRPKDDFSLLEMTMHNGVFLALCAAIMALAPCARAGDAAPWWHRYTTVATDPEFKSLEDIRTVNADCWRAAGWFGGWYGFWFADMLEKQTNVPDRWNRVIQAGSRPMMYYDAGEVGDFVTLIDEEKKTLLLDGWHWEKWTGQKGTVRWFGLDAFMNNVSWAPYPTAKSHGLPAFTYPDGRGIPEGKLYEVLAVRDLKNQWSLSLRFTNPDITDELAQKTGLAQATQRQVSDPNVQQGSGWVIGRLTSEDHANPQLLEYQCRELEFAIKRFRPGGVHIDNFGDSDIWQVNQSSFGLWSIYTYRTFLKRHFTPEQLDALGVKDADTFDIREYIATAYGEQKRSENDRLRDPRWLDDVLFRSHLINKTELSLQYWQGIYRSGKRAMEQAGLNNPIFGNTIPLLPGGGFMKGICDIAHFEWKTKGAFTAMPEMGLPPKARIAYVSRLGQKVSNVSYCWPSLYVPKRYSGQAYENLHKVLAFDCLANRGIMDYHNWYLDSYSPGTDQSAGYINTFIRAVAPELSGREYRADIGLVYCPWSNVASIDAMGLRPAMFLNEYKGWCDYLGNTHAQWDIILSQDMSLEALRRYKVVVLPSMLVLTDAQAAVLDQYLKAGGRVVATGETGTFFGPDGYLVHRPASLLDRFAGRPGLLRTTEKPGKAYFESGWKDAAGLRRLMEACGLTPSLSTNAPEEVGVNASILERDGASLLTIDLNNYAYDLATDAVTPTKPCTVSVGLPKALLGGSLEVVCADPEKQGGGVWQALPAGAWQVEAGGRTLRIEIPSFKFFLTIAVKIKLSSPSVSQNDALRVDQPRSTSPRTG